MQLVKFKDKIYTTQMLEDTLCALGVQRGDSICVHTEIWRFGIALQSKETFNKAILDIFVKICGDEGNVLIPTFTYSFCENKIFDVCNTPSKVGMLGDFFLKNGAIRTHCPIFSFAIKGKLAKELCQISNEALGKDSIFDKMLHLNSKILTFGNQYLGYTFVHFVESVANVPYRFDKTFSGILKDELGLESQKSVVYKVRHLDQDSILDYVKIAHFLKDLGILKVMEFGGGDIGVMDYKMAFNTLLEQFQKDSKFFLKESL
ncbi:acetyltransferase [Helicobacter sp. MIT 11-5569]|uniref:AAC(3) family N-acetyltransferase n=1 Tax=Helicobacter sp. MIT 11-5569 TaxID=1548151 RepID=UPI00068980BD|nr:AAC(3) family N-acetyltransferase [Helicobacter sp. MIT 11-5569]TLD83465.1 acetyltransferase [Helicobacter sp. MIT 11-5569]